MSTSSLPAPITLAELASAASQVADAARALPLARKARMVAVYLDAEVNRMSGDELYELRRKANLSQAEFADRLGVSQATISGMELGRRPVTAQAATLAMMLASRARRAARA